MIGKDKAVSQEDIECKQDNKPMVIDEILPRLEESSDESVYEEEGIFEIQEQTFTQMIKCEKPKAATKYLVFDVASLYLFRYDTLVR